MRMKSIIRILSLGTILLGGAGSTLALDLPDPAKTPGDVLTTDTSAVCTPGYTKTVRNVPAEIKKQVYRNYGIISHKPGEYEVDHLVSLELGGSNSIRNLWPESYITKPLNAHVKDKLENKLHELVCNGSVSIVEAQRAIAENWIDAYKKYVGPLPTLGTRENPQPSSGSSLAPQSENTLQQRARPDGVGNCPPTAPVKVSRTGIYHVQSDVSYNRTHAKSCFPTTEDAENAGYRAPKSSATSGLQ
jgi:hypothetical protein